MCREVVATYIAGEAMGSILQIIVADKLGRIRFMQLACVIVTIGCAIQTGAVNVGMFLAGRVIAGVAVGYVLFLFHYLPQPIPSLRVQWT